MSDDLFDLIRRHDPAAALRPLPETATGAMRDRILASAPPRRAPRRRLRPLVIAAAVAAMAVAGAATVYSSIGGGVDHAPTVNREFAAVTARMPLPPGATWKPLHLPPNALYGKRFALMAAIGQSQCAWYGYWRSAAAAGNSAAIGRSYTEARALRRMMPRHFDGQPEDAGGYDRGSLIATDQLITTAHHGDFTSLGQYLRANC